MKILGIETSCDETGVAIYDSKAGLLGHLLYSQIKLHAPYGGVIPELASRDHIKKVLPLIDQLLKKTELSPQAIAGIAYTSGPGLMGSLLVGAALSQSLGLSWNIPTLGIHHIEAHLLAPLLEKPAPQFPFVALIISGGHTLLIRVEKFGHYELLGQSLDDAAGEAFDKTAKILGLPYPGGPLLAQLALKGNPHRFHFPRPMTQQPGLDFSFSGLKTAVLYTLKEEEPDQQRKADIAASFQETIIETLLIKCKRALEITGLKRLVVAGGVSANLALRSRLQSLTHSHYEIYFPRIEFSTDNGAMIAYTGCQRLLAGQKDDLKIMIRPRWPISELNNSSAS